MSVDPSRGPGTLPFEVADQIDQVCDRYEAARDAGRGPRIEDYLDEVTASGRSALLGELLASELEWRRCRGEHPTPEEYAGRFPGDTARIAAAFDEASTVARPALRRRRGEARTGDRKAPGGAGIEGLQPGIEPLPGYLLRRRLGRGGFGEVWEAEAPGGVPVALKFVRLHDAQGTVERRALETIKGIRHPNLLSLFGAWQVVDLLIIGMELADRTLMDRFHLAEAEGLSGIPGDELIEYLAETAKGIDHLNEHIHALDDGPRRMGVQHRDIKPQNILLIGGGVKVADFGLARLLDRSITGHTGSLTPSYAAPEFFQNQTSDHSDQYSLAVTYCLLRGGRLPFTGGAAAVMAGHLHRPPDLTMLPEAERPVVARALSKEPAGRWPNCRTFVAALRASLSAKAPATGPSAPRPRGRMRRLAAGSVLALLALGLAIWRTGLFALISTDPEPVPPRPQPADKGEPAGSEGPSTPLVGLLDVRQAPPAPAVSNSSATEPARPGDEPPVATEKAAGPDPRRVGSYLASGDASYARGDYELAIEAYSESIWHDPRCAAAYNNRGNAYGKLGHHGNAIEDYDKAIQLEPKDPRGHDNRGNAHCAQRRYEQAIGDFSRAITLDPDNAVAFANRAYAHEQLGDHDRARQDRERAAQLESHPRRSAGAM